MTTTENPSTEEATLTPKAPSKKPSVKKALAPKKAPVAKKVAAPKKTEKETTLAQDAFEAEMQQLTERAKADGLNTVRAMTQIFARQGMKTIEGFLASLEAGNTPTPTKKKR